MAHLQVRQQVGGGVVKQVHGVVLEGAVLPEEAGHSGRSIQDVGHARLLQVLQVARRAHRADVQPGRNAAGVLVARGELARGREPRQRGRPRCCRRGVVRLHDGEWEGYRMRRGAGQQATTQGGFCRAGGSPRVLSFGATATPQPSSAGRLRRLWAHLAGGPRQRRLLIAGVTQQGGHARGAGLERRAVKLLQLCSGGGERAAGGAGSVRGEAGWIAACTRRPGAAHSPCSCAMVCVMEPRAAQGVRCGRTAPLPARSLDCCR